MDVNIKKFFKNERLDVSENSKELRNKIIDLVKEYACSAHIKKDFIPGKTLIPVSGKVYNEYELMSLVSASLDFWLTTDRFNSEFERKLSEFLGIPHTLTTNSGSSANLLAISALTSTSLGERSLKPNDEVITVATGFPTTINPILQNNLVPVFVDVTLPTYQIDVEKIENVITEKTKAIMLAHTLGNPFDLNAIMKIVKKHNLWLIEDCCDALGSKYNDQYVGNFGDISTLSFFPAHQITMGEGGSVLTKNSNLKRILESFRDWGRDCFCSPGKNNTCGKRFDWQLGNLPIGYDHKYIYSNMGYNLKITEMQAAIGLSQLQKLPEFVNIRKKNFVILKEGLKSFDDLILPESTKNSDPCWFGFPITVKESASFSRSDIVNFLAKKLIDTRPMFAGNIIRQPYFSNQKYKTADDLKNSDLIMNNSFWIGVFPGLSEAMINYVVKQISIFIKTETK